MKIVSGCPRSGTSLMMELLRVTLGDERIVGAQWPQEQTREIPNDTKGRKSLREWRQSQRPKRDHKDMNPYGFWECEYTVQGIKFNPRKPVPDKDKFCKIVSQGLAQSDPKYINKVIFMLRHPRTVAKSQEKLVRSGFNDEGDPEKDGVAQKVHEARMFNRVTPAAAWWLLEFKVPYLIVEFDDLIEDPDTQLERVRLFLGEGDMSSARSVINPELRRSIPQDRKGREWEIADELYNFMRTNDLAGIEPYLEAEAEKPREIEQLMCPRLQRVVAINECKLCRSDPNTYKNFMAQAIAKDIDWYQTPCGYDCIVDDKTVEESIAEKR